MNMKRFTALKAKVIGDLSAEQCVELETLVGEVASARLGEVAVARKVRHMAAVRRCPLCDGGDVVKHGRDKAGRQRFRCRRTAAGGCGHTFNALTGTPFARMRMPEKWVAYARLMRGFRSLDSIIQSGIGISRMTAWRWRHRMLRVQAALQTLMLGGVIEVDETFFRSSYKGHRGWLKGNPPEKRPARHRGGPAVLRGLSGEQIPVLTALDRAGGLVEVVLNNRSCIAAALNGRIADGSVLCSDGLAVYADMAARHGSEHRRVNAQAHAAHLNLGHVNAHHERLKTFVNRLLRGVSTRYLPNYLGWLRAMRHPEFTPELLVRQALSTPM